MKQQVDGLNWTGTFGLGIGVALVVLFIVVMGFARDSGPGPEKDIYHPEMVACIKWTADNRPDITTSARAIEYCKEQTR